jgi:hypothetical protein
MRGDAKAIGGGQEEIRIRLGVGDVVACHHRNPRWQTEKTDGVARAAGLTGERVDEEAAAHAHSAVDAPHGELQRLVPGENMLVDAVDEGAVDVEEHGRRATRPTHRVRNGESVAHTLIIGEAITPRLLDGWTGATWTDVAQCERLPCPSRAHCEN